MGLGQGRREVSTCGQGGISTGSGSGQRRVSVRRPEPVGARYDPEVVSRDYDGDFGFRAPELLSMTTAVPFLIGFA